MDLENLYLIALCGVFIGYMVVDVLPMAKARGFR